MSHHMHDQGRITDTGERDDYLVRFQELSSAAAIVHWDGASDNTYIELCINTGKTTRKAYIPALSFSRMLNRAAFDCAVEVQTLDMSKGRVPPLEVTRFIDQFPDEMFDELEDDDEDEDNPTQEA